jgi:hypothetical protein
VAALIIGRGDHDITKTNFTPTVFALLCLCAGFTGCNYGAGGGGADCGAPIQLTCQDRAYSGNTCGAGDTATSSCSEVGAEEVFYEISLAAGECCQIRFPYETGMKISGGATDAYLDPCGPEFLCGTFAGYDLDARPGAQKLWFYLESHEQPCGPYSFTVEPVTCPEE